LERIGKVTPLYTYKYKNLTIILENIIKDNFIFKINDGHNKPKRITIYNLKNLYDDDLLKVAKNYHLDYYSKLGEEYHIINKDKYYSDSEYKRMVLLSNELDNKVIIDIAYKMLEYFKSITGNYPKTIFTNGSIARSYLLSYHELKVKDLQYKTMFSNNKYYDILLDYSMKSYHGGKIESYVLGYIKNAKIIDITSAYPYALSILPRMTNDVFYYKNTAILNNFFYAFINCDIEINNSDFIHPVNVKNPINNANISPYGTIENVVITKFEYDYLIKNNIKVVVHDFIGIRHIENDFPYRNLVYLLFNSRMENKIPNPSLSDMFKKIINSLYGITFELTDVFKEVDDKIEWVGYRAGDYFNPVIASYITAIIRTYLSEVGYNIIENKGEVYLNMTDSIIYNGDVTLDVFSEKKILGKFENPDIIEDVIILGAGRYEYKKDINKKYVIKNRGFSVSIKDKSFYSQFDLKEKISIKNKVFVTSFKATTNKFNFNQLGYLLENNYIINPFNLGGKRIIENYDLDLNKTYTKTKAVKLEKGVL
jgi:hypothetical protein